MYKELVKRLREESEIERWLQPHSANETPKLLDDAADAIEKLCSFIGAEDADRMEAYPPKEERA